MQSTDVLQPAASRPYKPHRESAETSSKIKGLQAQLAVIDDFEVKSMTFMKEVNEKVRLAKKSFRELRQKGLTTEQALDSMRLVGMDADLVFDVFSSSSKTRKPVKEFPAYHHKRRF